LSDANIPEGSEILSINGFTPKQIIDGCGPYISHAPEIKTRPLQRIPRLFSELCTRALKILPPYKLIYRAPSDGAKAPATATVEGITDADFNLIYGDKFPHEPEQSPFTLDIQVPKNVAVLKLQTFEDSDGLNFAKELDAAFLKIKTSGVQNLILDLRQNGGGPSAAGIQLYSHLARAPFHYAVARQLTDGFRQVVWSSTERQLVLMELVVSKERDAKGGYRLTEAEDEIQQPRPDAYTGALFVLIDGASFSTASNVATIIKHYGRGKFIGEETGTPYSHDSGATFDVVLPRTGLRAVVPIVWYQQPVGPENAPLRGVLPDVTVHPTVDDILGRTDSVMTAAMALVSE
jgi:C-terminal processing protease CtpA/Prc